MAQGKNSFLVIHLITFYIFVFSQAQQFPVKRNFSSPVMKEVVEHLRIHGAYLMILIFKFYV